MKNTEKLLCVMLAALMIFLLSACNLGTSGQGSDGTTAAESPESQTAGEVTTDPVETGTSDATTSDASPVSSTADGTGTVNESTTEAGPVQTDPQTEPQQTEPVQTAPQTEPQQTEPVQTDPPVTEPQKPTEAELKAKAEEFLATPGLNGLMIHVFENPRAASLYDIVYQLKDPSVDSGKLKSIYAAHGRQYIDETGITYAGEEYLDTLLKKHTGYGFGEFSTYDTFLPTHFPEEKLFCVQHGDTNFQQAEVTSVSVYANGQIEILYKGKNDSWIMSFGGDRAASVSSVRATLVRAVFDLSDDGNLVVRSNRPVILEDGIDPLYKEVNSILNAQGVNGILKTQFTPVNVGFAVRDIVSQLRVWRSSEKDVPAYPDMAAIYKANGLETGDTGFSYADDDYLGSLITAATGIPMPNGDLNMSDVDILASEGLLAVQHGDMTYVPVVISMISIWRDGYLVTYKADPKFGDSFLVNLGGDYRWASDMQVYLVRNEDDGRLNIVSNLPVWYASETDNASYIIQPIMLQMNVFGVNGLLHSEYGEAKDADIREVLYQSGDSTPNLDYQSLFKKYGYVFEEGPGIKAMSGEELGELLEKYTGYEFEEFADYQDKYALYLRDEDVYAAFQGGVTYERMTPITVTWLDDGTYEMTYRPADSDIWYYRVRGGDSGSSARMQATLMRSPYGNYAVLSNGPAESVPVG